MTDEGTMEEYICILFTHNSDWYFRMSQPHLINRNIDSIPDMKDSMRATTTDQTGEILTKGEGRQIRKEYWNYRSVTMMLDFLVNYTHPEMAYTMHQYDRFCKNPKHSYEKAVKG